MAEMDVLVFISVQSGKITCYLYWKLEVLKTSIFFNGSVYNNKNSYMVTE